MVHLFIAIYVQLYFDCKYFHFINVNAKFNDQMFLRVFRCCSLRSEVYLHEISV